MRLFLHTYTPTAGIHHRFTEKSAAPSLDSSCGTVTPKKNKCV